jgi:hypothetical protein
MIPVAGKLVQTRLLAMPLAEITWYAQNLGLMVDTLAIVQDTTAAQYKNWAVMTLHVGR